LRLIEEFGLTHQAAAEAVGRSRAAVSNLLRLMELADEVKELLNTAALKWATRVPLLGLTSRRQQIEVAASLPRSRCRCAKRRHWCAASSTRTRATRMNLPRWILTFTAWSANWPTNWAPRLAFQHTPSGKGKLVVSYNTLDELEGILGHIQ